MRELESDVRAKIEDFISGFLSDNELKSLLLKWELMKGEGIINDIKSAIMGNFHGEVFNDYQNILKEKYYLRKLEYDRLLKAIIIRHFLNIQG